MMVSRFNELTTYINKTFIYTTWLTLYNMKQQKIRKNKKGFLYPSGTSQKPNAIRCSKELITFIRKNIVYGESFEDVLWRMIATKKLTGNVEKDVKKAGYEKYIDRS